MQPCGFPDKSVATPLGRFFHHYSLPSPLPPPACTLGLINKKRTFNTAPQSPYSVPRELFSLSTWDNSVHHKHKELLVINPASHSLTSGFVAVCHKRGLVLYLPSPQDYIACLSPKRSRVGHYIPISCLVWYLVQSPQ